MDFLLESPVLLTTSIFVARILDVALGTVRSILVFRGHPIAAAGLGFLEVLIWLVAASQVI